MNINKNIVFAIAILSSFSLMAHCPPNHHRADCHHHHHCGLVPATLGFVGGVICGVGCAINPSCQKTTIVNTTPNQQQPIVIVHPPKVESYPVQTTTITTATSTGTYTVQKTKVWVNGYFVDVINPDGTVDRRWISGHYEYR